MAKAVTTDASALGIDLASGKETELFKWFLACLLFGKPIQKHIAQRAEVCGELKQRYATVSNLLAQADTTSELSRRLQEFKHIGPITARIFFARFDHSGRGISLR